MNCEPKDCIIELETIKAPKDYINKLEKKDTCYICFDENITQTPNFYSD